MSFDLVEAPRSDIVDEQRLRRRMKWVRRSLIAAPVIAVLASMQAVTLARSAPVASVVSQTPAAADVAIAEVAEWLGDAGEVTGWVGFVSTPGGEGSVVEVHTVGVSMPPNMWRASVAVAVAADGTVRVVSGVSVEPTAIGAEMSLGWPDGLDSLPLSDSVDAAALAWAEAFVSGDPTKLRLVTGDPDPEHVYVPLAGWTVSAANTVSGVIRPDGMGAVRVGVSAVRSDGIERSFQFDVLFEAATTASPRAVAWGPVGSGMSLVAYQNATVRSDAGVQPTASSTTTTSSIPADTVPETIPATVPATVPPVPETVPATAPAPPVETAPATAPPAPVETTPGTLVAGAGS